MNELTVILSCTWKFALTFPFAIFGMEMSFYETLLYTNIGGILGVIFFALLSSIIIKLVNRVKVKTNRAVKRNKRKFTKKNKTIIKIKQKFGLPGIVILNPVILSIPVGTFLVTKYFGKKKINFIYLIIGQFGWSLIYTTFYMFINDSLISKLL
jgi:hypothetical protein